MERERNYLIRAAEVAGERLDGMEEQGESKKWRTGCERKRRCESVKSVAEREKLV